MKRELSKRKNTCKRKSKDELKKFVICNFYFATIITVNHYRTISSIYSGMNVDLTNIALLFNN